MKTSYQLPPLELKKNFETFHRSIVPQRPEIKRNRIDPIHLHRVPKKKKRKNPRMEKFEKFQRR